MNTVSQQQQQQQPPQNQQQNYQQQQQQQQEQEKLLLEQKQESDKQYNALKMKMQLEASTALEENLEKCKSLETEMSNLKKNTLKERNTYTNNYQKQENEWKSTLDEANQALEIMQRDLTTSQTLLKNKEQENYTLTQSIQVLEKSSKKFVNNISSLENSVHLEKTSKKKLMEQQQGYQQAFIMVETCVHAVRNEGEIFLSNLEGERRAHEAEVVSTEYHPTTHPILASSAAGAGGGAGAISLSSSKNSIASASSRVHQYNQRTKQQQAIIASLDLNETTNNALERRDRGVSL